MADFLEEEERPWAGDPALDPLLWVNAGGNCDLTINPGAAVPIRSAAKAVALVRLPRPHMVVCQFSRVLSIGSHGASITQSLRARIDWQGGRGAHTAFADISHGTVFTLAAAQAVDIQAVLSGTSGGQIDAHVECSLVPGTSSTPMPATFTQVSTAPGGAVAGTAVDVPTFARRLYVLSSTLNSVGFCQVDFLSNAVVIMRQIATANEAIQIGGIPHDQVQVTDVSGTGAVYWLVWELDL